MRESKKLEEATEALNKALTEIHTNRDAYNAVSLLADALIEIISYLETERRADD